MKIEKVIVVVSFMTLASSLCYGEGSKPKFGPAQKPLAVPLFKSNDYFRNSQHPAPQFWALISYYIPQFSGASCSVASVAMTVNAARTQLELTSEDGVVTEPKLLDSVEAEHWKSRTTSKVGYFGKFGVPLDSLEKVALESLKKNGFPNAKIEKFHLTDRSKETRTAVLKSLQEFESNPEFYILANFDQKEFTNDVHAGHVAPIGAYDSKNEKVLILDPDREYFMPYWVSLDTFIAGMNTQDTSSPEKPFRGYLTIQPGKPNRP